MTGVRRLWRNLRRGFRWLRILVLLALLLLLAAGIYLSQAGLPQGVKERLVQDLRARGLAVEMEQVRLNWFRGVIAEGLVFGPVREEAGPKFTIQEAELRLNGQALRRFGLQIDGLGVRRGRLEWPLDSQVPGTPPLVIEGISSELTFRPPDEWQLDRFEGQLGDLRFTFTGSLTNASRLKDWKLPQGPERPPLPLELVLARAQRVLQNLQYSGTPTLQLHLHGDALLPHQFQGNLRLASPSVEFDEAWGATGAILLGRLQPQADPASLPPLRLEMHLETLRTPWGRGGDLRLVTTLAPALERPLLTRLDLQLSAAHFETEWGASDGWVGSVQTTLRDAESGALDTRLELRAGATRLTHGTAAALELQARVRHSTREWLPANGLVVVQLEQARRGEARLEKVRLKSEFQRLPAPAEDPALAYWNRFMGWDGTVEGEWEGLVHPRVQAERGSFRGGWRPPQLSLEQIGVELYGGRLEAAGDLNILSRLARFSGRSEFDLLKIRPLLTEGGSNWLSQFEWKRPPVGGGEGEVVLPPWTEPEPDWRRQVRPTLQLHGAFETEAASFRGIPVDASRGRFRYREETWTVEDLQVARPEGGALLEIVSSDVTRGFSFQIDSRLHPRIGRHLFEPRIQEQVFDRLELTDPPHVQGVLRGHWGQPEAMEFTGRVAVTNAAFRGERVDRAESGVGFTNLQLHLIEPRIERSGQFGRADRVEVNIPGQFVSITNGFARWDPLAFSRWIGPHATEALQDYLFHAPPDVEVAGRVSWDSIEKTDLAFKVEGQNFQWWKMHTPQISGNLFWRGYHLLVTNLQAQFYGGRLSGWSGFAFGREEEPHQAQMFWSVEQADLQSIVRDVLQRTNQLSGTLAGQVQLQSGDVSDPSAYTGRGTAHLKNGYLWGLPVFGFLTEYLNPILPGVARITFEDGKGTFRLQQGTLHTEDLELTAVLLRLRYQGSVALNKEVQAEVQGELLGGIPYVGAVLAVLTKPASKTFEFEVQGTVDEPKARLSSLPVRWILFPLRIPGLLWDAITPEREGAK